MDALFWDNESGGYFTVTGRDTNILLRLREDNDSAEPAASSVAALNLARLAAIRNDAELLGTRKKNGQRLRPPVGALSKCVATDAGGV